MYYSIMYSSDACTCPNLLTWLCPKTRLMIAYAPPNRFSASFSPLFSYLLGGHFRTKPVRFLFAHCIEGGGFLDLSQLPCGKTRRMDMHRTCNDTQSRHLTSSAKKHIDPLIGPCKGEYRRESHLSSMMLHVLLFQKYNRHWENMLHSMHAYHHIIIIRHV